jgi:MFS family permease
MRLSLADAIAYAIMVGFAELYFVPDAIRLGAGPMSIGLLVGLPLGFGALGAATGLHSVRRIGRRRPVVVTGALLQAGSLFTLAAAEWFGSGSAQLLVIAACAYHFCAQLTHSPWASWLGDIVPAPIRGRYFSRRIRTVHITSFAAILLAGLILHLFESPTSNEGKGFVILFVAAGLARLCSVSLLTITPEPPSAIENKSPLVPSLRPSWSAAIDRIALVAGLLFFTVYLSSPFFTPYMLEQLAFDYVEFTLATAAMVAMKMISLPQWGKALDRFGPAAVYRLAIVLLALVPIPWLWISDFWGVAAAQAFSGFAWAGHEAAFFTLVLQTTRSSERPRAYALQAITTGTGQVLGGVCGGVFVSLLLDPRAVFAVSAVARLAAVVVCGFALVEVFRHARIGRRTLLFRVIGLRPSGGPIHRPVDPPPQAEANRDRAQP